ncbi:MAG: FecR family protein [Elusimicrobiales bacterium]
MALPGALLAAESRLLSMSGPVEVRPTREGAWTAAAADAEIAEGGAVRTGPKGAAVIQMPNKTRVWLKENSNIELEQRQTLASRLALVFGRIKVRVPHLMRKEKFEVRTPAAVCAVRGTEFTMGTTEDGKMDLQVLFGEVKLKFMIPPDKGPSEFSIPQGQGLALTEKARPPGPNC